MTHYALALDVGGTFTDVMLMHRESGQLWTVKTASTPTDPSEGFSQGIQKIDIQHDVMRTYVQRGPHYDLAGMEAVYRAMQADAAAHLSAEGLSPERQSFQRLADLRYARQGFEVTVDFSSQKVSAAAVEQLLQAFHRRHEQLYTYAAPDTPVEIVNLRLRAIGQMATLALPRIATAAVPGTTPDPIQTLCVTSASSPTRVS